MMSKILLPFKKILAMVFGLYFMLLTVGQVVKPFEPLDKENLKLDIAIFSDIHMEGNVFKKHVIIPRCFNALNGGKEYIDAVAMVGDNSMCAQNIENMFFYGVLNDVNPIKPYYPAMGNHDIGCDDLQFGTFEELRERQLDYLHLFVDKNIDELYYSEVVNGYHLIFMGPDAPENMVRTLSDKQLDWLDTELAKASESGLPIFVFNHHPYHVIGQGYDRYVSILNKYDNVFLIVGHAHDLPHAETLPGEKGIPEIWVPSLTGNQDESYGFSYQMEVYEDTIVFRVYDYLEGCFTGQELSFAIK